MNEFKKPELTDEKWDALQKYLEDISKLSIEVENDIIEMNNYYNKVRDNLTRLSVSIGLIDHVLGREYPLEVAMDKIKEGIKPKTLEERAEELFKYNTHIWAVCCDPNLGDYFKEYLSKDAFENYKSCILEIFDLTQDLYKYMADNHITL